MPSSRRGRRRRPALIFTLAFVGASCLPVYAVFLDARGVSFLDRVLCYFLWLYKEVKPEAPAWLRGRGSDIAAAVLLGAATYSKPPNHALLVAPIVIWLWWRRKRFDGVLVGAVGVLVACALFGLTALNAGEFNYQGGDRKTFYDRLSLRRLRQTVSGTQRQRNEHERFRRRQRAAPAFRRTGSSTTSNTF